MAWSCRIAAAVLIGFGSHAGSHAAAQPRVAPAEPRTDALGDPLPPRAVMRLGMMRWRPSGWIQDLAFAPDGVADGDNRGRKISRCAEVSLVRVCFNEPTRPT